MSTSTPAERMRGYREHYRQFVEYRDGHRYNPVLDDPKHPDNPMGWVHGSNQAYRFAGCGCAEKCGPAMAEANRQEAARRLERRTEADRAYITVAVRNLMPTLSRTEAADVAARMAATRIVRDATRAKVAYDPRRLEEALRAWGTDAGRPDVAALTSAAVTELCAAVCTRLSDIDRRRRPRP